MGSETVGQNKMIVIIDYGMGNVRSVAKAFEFLGALVCVTNNPEKISRASHLVLPGVGAFGRGMEHLNRYKLVEVLSEEALIKKKPFLGICLGMQLLGKESEEFGIYKGLGWIDAKIKKFDLDDKNLKISHVGWNNIILKKDCPLFLGVKENIDFYFVHSFFMECKSAEDVVATCNYGHEFTAAIQKENIFATQFHPEKSQNYGLKILENFFNIKNYD